MQDISVSGSLNCLAEFWKFAETIPTVSEAKTAVIITDDNT